MLENKIDILNCDIRRIFDFFTKIRLCACIKTDENTFEIVVLKRKFCNVIVAADLEKN